MRPILEQLQVKEMGRVLIVNNEVKLAFFISNIIFSKSSLIEWKFK